MEQYKLKDTPATGTYKPSFVKDTLLDMPVELSRADILDAIYKRKCGETIIRLLKHDGRIDCLTGTIDILKEINRHPILKKGYRVDIV